MLLKITILTLLGSSYGFDWHDSFTLTNNLQDYHEEPSMGTAEERSNPSSQLAAFFSKFAVPLHLTPPAKSQDHVQTPHPHNRKRRVVPITSFGRTGEEGETAYNPNAASDNQTQPEEEIFDDNNSTQTNDTTQKPSVQTEDEISSTSSVYQKPLPAGQEGQDSFTVPGGSIFEVNWKPDEMVIKTKVPIPNIPTFNVGFGRRR